MCMLSNFSGSLSEIAFLYNWQVCELWLTLVENGQAVFNKTIHVDIWPTDPKINHDQHLYKNSRLNHSLVIDQKPKCEAWTNRHVDDYMLYLLEAKKLTGFSMLSWGQELTKQTQSFLCTAHCPRFIYRRMWFPLKYLQGTMKRSLFSVSNKT